MKVLLVDDDPDLSTVIAFTLQQAGYMVVKATDGFEGLRAFEREQPDIAVLDVNMPRMNGFELARRIREQSQVPVVMLTVRDEEEDVVEALSLGADDYLTKPFSPRILLARINAVLRRAGIESEGSLTYGPLTLDLDELTLEGLPQGTIRLTPLEMRLLQLLLANGGHTVPTERILVHVWGNRAGGNRQLLKQLVHRLRQKMETDAARPRLLKTIPNAGYMIDAA